MKKFAALLMIFCLAGFAVGCGGGGEGSTDEAESFTPDPSAAPDTSADPANMAPPAADAAPATDAPPADG